MIIVMISNYVDAYLFWVNVFIFEDKASLTYVLKQLV